MTTRALVAGSGGFIGHHLVKYLVAKGYWVRGVDTKTPEYESTAAHEFQVMDLRRLDNCLIATGKWMRSIILQPIWVESATEVGPVFQTGG